MKFTNPANGHEETVLGSLHWLWCFLWTPVYYAVKGIWSHAIISFVLAWLIGVTLGISIIIALIYAILNKSIVRKHYLHKGWVEG